MRKCIGANDAYLIRKGLNGRSLVFVGMMGSGKSAIGKRIAANLEIPFVDADEAIEEAAQMSISDIFDCHGEAYFRDGERRVIKRLLGDRAIVLSTGGGAFMDEETRALVKDKGVSVWLDADFDVLMERVRRKPGRPLLQTKDPEKTMRKLLAERAPVYALSDVAVKSYNDSHEAAVERVAESLMEHLNVKSGIGVSN